jgi:UPF0042 nucleotide-binding protein
VRLDVPSGQQPFRILILTGQSGAGKSTAMHALEDVGYFCVDNLPTALAETLVAEVHKSATVKALALGMDMREKNFLDQGPALVQRLRAGPHPVRLIFLQAQEEVVLRRYSQTRRLHPLDDGAGLRSAIVREQAVLGPLRELADEAIDTSQLSVHMLRSRIMSQFDPEASAQDLRVTVLSFGFKYGVPTEADMVLDVRFVPNPYFVPELRPQTGLDKDVSAFVLDRDEAQTFLQHAQNFLQFLVPRYRAEGKCYFTVAIGCTGGRHRSVALAQKVAQSIAGTGVAVDMRHRDIDRDTQVAP